MQTKSGSFKQFQLVNTDSMDLTLRRHKNSIESKSIVVSLRNAHVFTINQVVQDKSGTYYPLKICFIDQSRKKLYFATDLEREQCLLWLRKIQGFQDS